MKKGFSVREGDHGSTGKQGRVKNTILQKGGPQGLSRASANEDAKKLEGRVSDGNITHSLRIKGDNVERKGGGGKLPRLRGREISLGPKDRPKIVQRKNRSEKL